MTTQFKNYYWYGMRLRGCSPGAQPRGFIERKDATGQYKRYYDLVCYERRLTEEECNHYSMDLLQIRSEEEKR